MANKKPLNSYEKFLSHAGMPQVADNQHFSRMTVMNATDLAPHPQDDRASIVISLKTLKYLLFEGDEFKTRTKIALCIIYAILFPIAVPAWGIEGLCRRLRKLKYFEFNAYSGTAYIILVFSIGVLLLLLLEPPWHFLGLYILFEIQVLGLAAAAVIPLDKWHDYHIWYLKLAGRRTSDATKQLVIGMDSVYLAILSFFYNAFFFGAAAYALSMWADGAFTHAPQGVGLDALGLYLYSGFVWVVTLGYADISPASTLARALCVMAFATGLLYSLVIFSLIVDRLAQLRSKPS